jgi:hypothetical protein
LSEFKVHQVMKKVVHGTPVGNDTECQCGRD